MSSTARIVIWQWLLGAGCVLTFLVLDLALDRASDQPLNQASSAALALGAVALPTLYYAWIQARTLDATRLLAHGVIRMVLTATLVAVCIVAIGIEPAGFFVTFAVMQGAYFVRGN